MKKSNDIFAVEISKTERTCPVGEMVGSRNLEDGKIPVLSCEGACIRGEIARLAANLVAKEEPYRRGCHGELFTVPQSALARWMKKAGKIVLIDGCFLRIASLIASVPPRVASECRQPPALPDVGHEGATLLSLSRSLTLNLLMARTWACAAPYPSTSGRYVSL